jgi:hypothetical protein
MLTPDPDVLAALLRATYDRAVETCVGDLPPDQQMAYRHACGLAWQRLDVPAIARQIVRGELSEDDILTIVRPFVAEAIEAHGEPSATEKSSTRLH